jgi:nucleoside-diphosphate-sugar epimerase
VTRVLVTGAGGFVGHAVAAALAARGHEVIATVRPGRRHLAHPLPQVEVVECELTDRLALERLVARVRPERAVHAAAAGARSRCDDLALLLRTNTEATAVLVAALADHGAERIVTLGSSSEYGTPAGAMSESLAPAPDDLYGVSKLAGGLAARAIARARGIACLHLRLFSVYGPGEAPSRLVPSVVRAVAAREPLELTGGRQVRDFVYVDDVVEAVLLALFTDRTADGTYNVGTGVETSVRELAELASALAGADPSLLRFGSLAYRGDERFAWRADTRLAAEALGWRATTLLPDGLASTLGAARSDLRMAA